jgi:hypothetical protein
MALKKTLGKAERLWTGKKQLFRLLHFFLSLDFGFSHLLRQKQIRRRKKMADHAL